MLLQSLPLILLHLPLPPVLTAAVEAFFVMTAAAIAAADPLVLVRLLMLLPNHHPTSCQTLPMIRSLVSMQQHRTFLQQSHGHLVVMRSCRHSQANYTHSMCDVGSPVSVMGTPVSKYAPITVFVAVSSIGPCKVHLAV